MREYHLRNFIGNPTESALAAASFMFSGALDEFPKLDIVLPHSGGVFPSLIGRWDHGATVRPEVKDLKHPPSHYLRRFHYDTVAHSVPILMNLVRQVGADRIVTGTDFPADMSVADVVGTVESSLTVDRRPRPDPARQRRAAAEAGSVAPITAAPRRCSLDRTARFSPWAWSSGYCLADCRRAFRPSTA